MAEINDIRLGTNQVQKVYLGNELSWMLETPDVTKPVTTIYPVTTNSYSAPRDVYFEVNEMCDTYYTTDGSTPTTSSTRYIAPVTINSDTTFKYFSVDVAGNVETVKTSTYTITGGQITSISPTSTTQNTIPFTVTLTNDQAFTIYYKVGAGTQQTYAGPFTVNQTTNNVGVNILVTYWSTGETEKTITYNTAGAIPGKPIVTATPGTWYVRLDWPVTANTTSYNVYRSTVSGQLGTLVSEYQTPTGYDDNTAQNGTTYYYTVRSANYGSNQSSDQVLATPNTIQTPTSYRYVRYIGYGDNTSLATSRLVELQAMHGATNRLYLKLPMAGYATPNGGAIAVATNGEFLQASGYPLWWSGQGIPDLKYDMGDWYAIDTIKVAGYSKTTDVRQTKFIIQVSVDNAVWVTVADYSTNTTPQPETGFSFAIT